MAKIDRLTRVNALVKRVIADYLERGGAMLPAGALVSITEVNCSVDLRNAVVFFSVLGGGAEAPTEALRALSKRRTDIQKVLADELKFKHTPHLKFESDTRMSEGDRILRLLDETEATDRHE
ncbi:MAG: 30S ribosome-binding factor RbfA [Victivallaceae bacterium]|nr:30S ribosome-binding factor RbfA [Victivallaceae bacterium]